MLIDTHSHIYSQEFNDDRLQAVDRAIEAGIEKIVLPNIDSSSIKPMLDLVDKKPDLCFPLIGLHPTSVKEDYLTELEILKYWMKKRKFHGIGEIGIDLYWDKTFLKEQIDAFRIQVQWAKEFDLPLIIHVRESFDEVMTVLKEERYENMKGVFHSFTGSAPQAEEVLEMGFHIGLNGIVTFKNSGLSEMVASVPVNRILMETDAPYLAPTPYRGKRNESAYLIHTARKVSEIKGVSLEKLTKTSTESAINLFGI